MLIATHWCAFCARETLHVSNTDTEAWFSKCATFSASVFLFYFDLKFTNSGVAGAYWNGFINLIVAGAFVYIFAELRALYRKQIELSRRYALTGLLNHRSFMEILASETRRLARHRRPLTIAYIDVDNFKLINDQYGHRAGDEFLKEIGYQMSARLRGTDSLARVGGDEFTVLLPETDQPSARLVVSEILKALRHSCAVYGRSTSVSIGAVTYTSAASAEAMVEMADRAMYAIKQKGKNNI